MFHSVGGFTSSADRAAGKQTDNHQINAENQDGNTCLDYASTSRIFQLIQSHSGKLSSNIRENVGIIASEFRIATAANSHFLQQCRKKYTSSPALMRYNQGSMTAASSYE